MAGWPKTPDHSFSHADDAAPAAAFLFLLFFFIKRSAYRYAGQPLATTKSGRAPVLLMRRCPCGRAPPAVRSPSRATTPSTLCSPAAASPAPSSAAARATTATRHLHDHRRPHTPGRLLSPAPGRCCPPGVRWCVHAATSTLGCCACRSAAEAAALPLLHQDGVLLPSCWSLLRLPMQHVGGCVADAPTCRPLARAPCCYSILLAGCSPKCPCHGQ